MCRRSLLLAYVMLGLGLGILIGYCLESWFLCTFGSAALLILSFGSMRRK